MTVLVGDRGNEGPGRGRCLEAISNLVNAVAVGQQNTLLLDKTPESSAMLSMGHFI